MCVTRTFLGAVVLGLGLGGCGGSAGSRPLGGGGDVVSGGGLAVGGASSSGGGAGGSAGASSGGASADGGVTTGGKATAGSANAPHAGSAGATAAGSGGMSSGNPEILVPSNGALLGQFYGDQDIATTTAKVGRALPLRLTYYDFDDEWYNCQPDLDAGRIPFVNWEPFGATLDAIIGGEHDDVLWARAQQAIALGAKLFVDFGAEMNGDWSPWSGAQNGQSPEKFVAAYRHVHDAFEAAGATNVIWAWCPNVTDEPRQAWNETLKYYPGDQYVDWACVDGYNWGGTNDIPWSSFHDVFQHVYAKLATLGKPIMIGEMASAETGGDKALWIAGIVPTLKQDFPLIKGVIWFDIQKEADWRISSSPAAEAAFAQMAGDPYFNP